MDNRHAPFRQDVLSHGPVILLLAGLLLGDTALGRPPALRSGAVQRFVSEQALRNLECVTRWEQICAADHARHHLLKVHRNKVRYLAWPDEDTEYTIVGQSRKVLRLAEPGSRQAVASLKLARDTATYTGPDNVPSECGLTGCAQVPECVPPEKEVTVRFVSETRLARRLRELMPLVPGGRCPEGRLEYKPPQAGERCLGAGRSYSPAAAKKPSSVSLDLEALRLFLSSDERTLLQNESKALIDVVQPFYASRLARRPKARGAVTVRLHFAGGHKPPEVYVQKDGPRDAELSKCLSAALRSREVFPWRPSQITNLELSFVFGS